ncbi:MAG: PhoX family phosphatase [Phormidesmis sp.]
MSLKRRHFLTFLGAAAGTSVLGPLGCQSADQSTRPAFPSDAAASGGTIGGSRTPPVAEPTAFKPLRGPVPYDAVNVNADRQPMEYRQYAIQDDIVLPDGFTYDVIASWGDAVGDSRFGYNNDYLSFVPTGPDEGYLTVNFEYISSSTWEQTYSQVIGKALPLDTVTKALREIDGAEIDAFELDDDNPLKVQITDISKEMLVDQGLGVISVRRGVDGKWTRVVADTDRRASGIAGLEDGHYLGATGPATAVFIKRDVKGYSDGLGNQIIGTFGNCAGGTTPWGTVLSAEENIQYQVPEQVHSDGSAFDPGEVPFNAGLDGQGNVFGLAGNKYGWIVEIDPSNPSDYGTKHTWMGRYRHEAVGVRAEAGQKLAFYSGCDRRGGHVYKFVSHAPVTDPTDKANSKLLESGMLYAAQFNDDGTGQWIALAPETAVNPVSPSQVMGGMVTLPKRPDGGFDKVEDDAVVTAFKTKFAMLNDLYDGTPEETQGAILIDAHLAANAVGATCTARPEDTEVAPDGTLFIAFTSGTPGGDGGPDNSVFLGPNGEEDYEAGWIMKVMEADNNPAALTFRWEMLAIGGEPTDGGIGFANPDNLEFDSNGNLWVVTDMSTGAHNKALPYKRVDESGKSIIGKDLLGVYGNNSLWQIALHGENAGEAKMFAYGPMECELTGPFFTKDSSTLFLAAQHPGERNGIRVGMQSETRDFEMKTTDGQTFLQKREVPVGSNWPEKTDGASPKPSVVAISRVEKGAIV